MWYLRLTIIFFICAAALAAKDLIIKHLFNSGVLFSQIVFYTGVFALLFSILLSWYKKEKFVITNKKYQAFRILIVCFSASFSFLSFKLLCPSIVNIGSKMTLPFMILISPLLALPYGKKEKYLAVFTLGIMSLFFYQSLCHDESIWFGILILLISTLFMIGEYITLNTTVKKESPVLICTIPSVALIMLGGIYAFVFNEPLFTMSTPSVLFLLCCGFSYFIVYYSGIIRYKLLPPGLAEYPSLMTILFIWPIDVFFFGGKISVNALIVGLTGLVLLSIIIREHRKTKIRNTLATEVVSP